MKKVLVIDDSSLSRRMARAILEDLGHEVEEAVNGDEGLEKYALRGHDLVLLDLVMPGTYGVNVLLRLLEMEPSLKVIVVTADIQRYTYSAVRQAGAVGLLNKPVNRADLTDLVAAVFSGHEGWQW